MTELRPRKINVTGQLTESPYNTCTTSRLFEHGTQHDTIGSILSTSLSTHLLYINFPWSKLCHHDNSRLRPSSLVKVIVMLAFNKHFSLDGCIRSVVSDLFTCWIHWNIDTASWSSYCRRNRRHFFPNAVSLLCLYMFTIVCFDLMSCDLLLWLPWVAVTQTNTCGVRSRLWCLFVCVCCRS